MLIPIKLTLWLLTNSWIWMNKNLPLIILPDLAQLKMKKMLLNMMTKILFLMVQLIGDPKLQLKIKDLVDHVGLLVLPDLWKLISYSLKDKRSVQLNKNQQIVILQMVDAMVVSLDTELLMELKMVWYQKVTIHT